MFLMKIIFNSYNENDTFYWVYYFSKKQKVWVNSGVKHLKFILTNLKEIFLTFHVEIHMYLKLLKNSHKILTQYVSIVKKLSKWRQEKQVWGWRMKDVFVGRCCVFNKDIRTFLIRTFKKNLPTRLFLCNTCKQLRILCSNCSFQLFCFYYCVDYFSN